MFSEDAAVPVTCLVGSSRFEETFALVAERLEKSGVLVLMMGSFQHADSRPVSDEERRTLERVDRRRVDLADEVPVIDAPRARCKACGAWHDDDHGETCWCAADGVQGGRASAYRRRQLYEEAPYVGESSRLEVAYALSVGKKVRYLSRQEERHE